MEITSKDRAILRELGKYYAEIATLDIQKNTILDWKKLNALQPVRPMVLIDQIPWHEMNINNELTLLCENEWCRDIEKYIRQTIYKWNHMETDMVVPSYIPIQKVIYSTSIGVEINEEIQQVDKENDIVAHRYNDQIADELALEQIHSPVITFDSVATNRYKSLAEEIFQDIIPVKMTGVVPHFAVWDELAMYRGVTPLLMDMIDRPEFIHATMQKFTQMKIDILKKLEVLDALEKEPGTVHCSGAYRDEVVSHLDNEEGVTAKQCWASGMGQIFSNCSKEMHEEFEIEYAKQYYEHCGLVYYGCCEPLHDRIDIIRKIPNVRKISISPWADVDIAATNIGRDYVMSRKTNPAFVAVQTMDEEQIKKEVLETLKACERYKTPCEFILKDISTVNYKPERLERWSKLVRSIIENY